MPAEREATGELLAWGHMMALLGSQTLNSVVYLTNLTADQFPQSNNLHRRNYQFLQLLVFSQHDHTV